MSQFTPIFTALNETKEFLRLSLKKYTLFVLRLSPHQNIIQGIVVYMTLCWIALCLPFMDHGVGFLDNLFTAASAASTAGMMTVNFADSYTFLGKLVVLCVVQVGGVGYMTMSAFIYLTISHRLRRSQTEVLNTEFALPNTVRLQDFLRAAFIFTIFAELIGAAFLYNYFIRHNYGVWTSVWYSIFHSISAFCTAGFSLFPDGLVTFHDSKTVRIVITVLSLAGAMGFIVVTDLFNRLRRKTKEISYTTKIIVLFTLAAISLSSFFIFLTNPGLSLTDALFQATQAMTTAGFNTVPLTSLTTCSLLVMMGLMAIGASPSGTGGGLKSTTATCLLAIVSSHLFGRKHITFLGRMIPFQRLYIAMSTFIFYCFMLFAVMFFLTWTETLPFLDLFCEASAALGTAGMSCGATADLSGPGKLIIIIAMLVGRVGVVTFGMALLKRDEEELQEEEKEIKREDLVV